MLTEKTFDTGAVVIHYAEGPAHGVPLVMLHGATARWQTFLSVLPLLAMRYHTYALDLRGHGLSGRTPGAYKTVDFPKGIDTFLREQVAEPAVLLGWSLGSDVALQLAAEAPELVRALILEDSDAHLITETGADETDPGLIPIFEFLRSTYDIVSKDPSFPHVLASLAAIDPQEDDISRRRRAKTLGQVDPEFLLEGANNTMDLGFRPGELAEKITCPVLLIRGDPALGGIVKDEDVDWYRSHIRDFSHIAVAGAGHNVHRTQPLTYYQHVMNFIEAI